MSAPLLLVVSTSPAVASALFLLLASQTAPARGEKGRVTEWQEAPSSVSASLSETVRGNGWEFQAGGLRGRLWLAVSFETLDRDLELPPSPFGNTGRWNHELAPGQLIAVVELLDPWLDARGHRLAVGTYTLRYVVQPWFKEHLGVSATRDFALWIPAEIDTRRGATQTEAMEWSRTLTETNHPAVMALRAPPDGLGELPVWGEDRATMVLYVDAAGPVGLVFGME